VSVVKCFFWYQLTRVVPTKGHKTVVAVVVNVTVVWVVLCYVHVV